MKFNYHLTRLFIAVYEVLRRRNDVPGAPGPAADALDRRTQQRQEDCRRARQVVPQLVRLALHVASRFPRQLGKVGLVLVAARQRSGLVSED